jgi:hypothetical protein
MNVLASIFVMPLVLLGSQPSTPPPTEGLPPDFPTKIWVQPALRELVSHMWLTSPTFRRQGLQVQATPTIQVQLRIDPTLVDNPDHRAICELRMYSGGGIIARLAIAPVRMPELIGHEMEHVIERLDGIRVERESRERKPGYYQLDRFHERFETDRAIRVGRQVMAEMSQSGPLTRTQ